jgi:hypothetical protein
MSLISSICAERGEAIREKWLRALREAIKNRDWKEVEQIERDMAEYRFSE